MTRVIGPTSGGTGWSTTRPAAKACRRSLLENSIGRGYPLRMVKLQQKISSCWRTLAGAEAFLALRSYVPTARKQGMNPLAVLRQLLRAAPGYQLRQGPEQLRPPHPLAGSSSRLNDAGVS